MRNYRKLSYIPMGMLDSHPLSMRITSEESCVKNIPGNKRCLRIIFQNLKQTWECCISSPTFPETILQTLKQTHSN